MSCLYFTILYEITVLIKEWRKSPKERDHLEDQSVDGRMGSEWILEILAGGV
jgi:hypothetical protein